MIQAQFKYGILRDVNPQQELSELASLVFRIAKQNNNIYERGEERGRERREERERKRGRERDFCEVSSVGIYSCHKMNITVFHNALGLLTDRLKRGVPHCTYPTACPVLALTMKSSSRTFSGSS